MRIVILLILIPCISFGQKGSSSFGIQFKPIIPVNYFDAGPVSSTDSISTINIFPKFGYSFGMVIRKSFTDKLAIETGINSVRRNYGFDAIESVRDSSDLGDFGFVSYEIPIQGLIYIRLSEDLYMNTSLGIAVNWYASDVRSVGPNGILVQTSERAQWANFSLLANIGFEYRTKDKGAFYLGASLVKPTSVITATVVEVEYGPNLWTKHTHFLNGNYITLDLRYFFHSKEEKPDNKTASILWPRVSYTPTI